MRSILAPVGLGLVFVLFGAVLTDYDTYLAGRVAVFVVLTLGLNLLLGMAGLLSLASAAFMGVGAYLTTILMTSVGLPVWLAVPVSVLAGWLAGWVLGLVSLRLSHFYLALISLGFLLTFQVMLLRGGDTTGGGYGLVAAEATVFGHPISTNDWALLALFLAGAAMVLAGRLASSRIGRAWLALKHNETMAELCGVNLLRNKTMAFALSSAMAALAGSVYAFQQGAVTPAAFNISASVDQLTYVIVGGLGSVWGALLGPLVLQLVPEYLRSLGEARELVFGVLLLVVLVAVPGGLAGLVARLAARVGPLLPDRLRSLGAGAAGADIRRAGRDPTPDGSEPPRCPARLAQAGGRSADRPVAMTVRNLSVRYGGVRAVEDASFEIREGSLHGLIGPNGAGKTTLLNALSGLVDIAGGSVRLGDTELGSERRRVRRRDLVGIGVTRTFQTPLVVPELSAIDNVMLGLHTWLQAGLVGSAAVSGRAARQDREARARCTQMLASLGVRVDIEAPAATLGFGELRRVELARSLVANPRLLILDEPTSGMELDDARNTVELLNDIQAFRETGGTALTILLVEHNVPLVFGSCDRVTAMHEGRILTTGDPNTVRLDPQVRESYLVPEGVSGAVEVATGGQGTGAVGDA